MSAPRAESRYVWEDLLARRVRPRTTPPPSKQEQKEIAEVKALTLPQAMERYRKHVDADENIAQTWPRLKAYFVARPEAATEIGKQIRAHELPEEGSAGVFVALGATPTTEARDALLGIKNDTGAQVFDRARAAFALVDRADVGVDLARSFRSESQAITAGKTRSDRLYGRHAALALGVMGSLKAADEPAVANETRGAIRDILGRGTTALALRPGFGTLANLGDPQMLGDVAPFMKSSDPAIRTAAAISFRRMSPASTRDLETSWLRTERDPEVRRELYHVIQLQHHDTKTVADRTIVAQAIADLAADPAPAVLTRQSIVHLLGEAKDEYPEAKAALLASVPREVEAREDGVMNILTQYLAPDEIAAAMPANGGGQ